MPLLVRPAPYSLFRKKVIEHIAKFPVVQSHYSREQNPKRKYLPENRMWLMYLAEKEPEQVELIKAKQKCTAEVKKNGQ